MKTFVAVEFTANGIHSVLHKLSDRSDVHSELFYVFPIDSSPKFAIKFCYFEPIVNQNNSRKFYSRALPDPRAQLAMASQKVSQNPEASSSDEVLAKTNHRLERGTSS